MACIPGVIQKYASVYLNDESPVAVLSTACYKHVSYNGNVNLLRNTAETTNT